MYTDAFLQLSGAITQTGSGTGVQTVVTGQTVTGTDTSVLSTNNIDLLTARDIGKGEPLNVDIDVITAASGGTSVEVQFVEADNAALSSNLKVLGSTGAIPVATLVAGARLSMRVPRCDPNAAKRYLGLRYVTVGAVAAGAYFATIVKDLADVPVYYPSGITVL